jgi:hypothetical protein
MIPAREVLVHGLGGGSADRACVLPDLKRDIDQRDNDRNCANHLSYVSEVGEIQGFGVETSERWEPAF